MAWLAWVEGDLKQAQTVGQTAIETFKSLPAGSPFWGAALWPLIGVNAAQNDMAAAVTHIKPLLASVQLRMPDKMTAILQQIIAAWEANQPETAQNHLQYALQLAQEMSYL